VVVVAAVALLVEPAGAAEAEAMEEKVDKITMRLRQPHLVL
jgi:hypothetical protein